MPKPPARRGLDEIAVLFEQISQIEKDHEFRFMSALAGLKRNHPAKESEPMSQEQVVTVDGYRCVFCGAVFDHRPDVCGVCEAIGAFEPTTYRKKGAGNQIEEKSLTYQICADILSEPL